MQKKFAATAVWAYVKLILPLICKCYECLLPERYAVEFVGEHAEIYFAVLKIFFLQIMQCSLSFAGVE